MTTTVFGLEHFVERRAENQEGYFRERYPQLQRQHLKKQGRMRKFIIDTDAGVDDAVALAMALDAHRQCSYPCFTQVEVIALKEPDQ